MDIWYQDLRKQHDISKEYKKKNALEGSISQQITDFCLKWASRAQKNKFRSLQSMNSRYFREAVCNIYNVWHEMEYKNTDVRLRQSYWNGITVALSSVNNEHLYFLEVCDHTFALQQIIYIGGAFT